MTSLVASELVKLRTTRAPYGLVLGLVVLSGLIAVGTVGSDILATGDDRALELADAVEAAAFFATLLGILLITNEYRHRTITPTFLVTPARERIVAAKVAAGILTGLACGAAAAGIALAVSLPWLAVRDQTLPLDGDLATAMLALVGVFALSAVLGIAIGALIRSQAGALVTTFVWFLIVEPIVAAVTALVLDLEIGRYLPGSALDALVSVNGDLLDPGWALLLVLLYLGVLLGIGLLVTLRQDVD
jgi:ABC-2 type transport system permease protein